MSGIYSSTAGVDARLAGSLTRLLPQGCLVLTGSTPLPIRNDYATPHTLGTDRIAEAVGAADRYPGENLLIVDAGTCITLDVVADGAYLGGNISPGIALRFKAMHEHSAALPEVKLGLHEEFPPFGRDTVNALKAGVLLGVWHEISGTYVMARHIFKVTRMILTGGDAPLLFPVVGQESPNVTMADDLVMTGLLKILQYNESI